jgi:hypothetical protein
MYFRGRKKRKVRRTIEPRVVKSFIPIYPNRLPTVPKPSRASRTASLVFSGLPASQSAITRLLNRCRGQTPTGVRIRVRIPSAHVLTSIGVRGIRFSVQAGDCAALYHSFILLARSDPVRNSVSGECNAFFAKALELRLSRETLEGITRYKRGIFSRETRPQKTVVPIRFDEEKGAYSGLPFVPTTNHSHFWSCPRVKPTSVLNSFVCCG